MASPLLLSSSLSSRPSLSLKPHLFRHPGFASSLSNLPCSFRRVIICLNSLFGSRQSIGKYYCMAQLIRWHTLRGREGLIFFFHFPFFFFCVEFLATKGNSETLGLPFYYREGLGRGYARRSSRRMRLSQLRSGLVCSIR